MCCWVGLGLFNIGTLTNYIEILHILSKVVLIQSFKTAKIKMFINYKREIYALAH